MTRTEWAAGGATLPPVVAVTVAVDAALGFALGLVAFPALVQGAHVLAAVWPRPPLPRRSTGRPTA